MDADERNVGVLVWGGIGAGCFPLEMGGVGSELAWVGWGCTAGLAGRLIAWSFCTTEVTVASVCCNISSTRAVLSSAGLSGVCDLLVPWKWIVLLLRYTQQFCCVEYLASLPLYCPVPWSGSRLSICSASRNLAVRSS